jgi:hypothetical protein
LRPDVKNNFVSSAETVGLPSSFALFTIGPRVCAGANVQAVGPSLRSVADEQNDVSNVHADMAAKLMNLNCGFLLTHPLLLPTTDGAHTIRDE